MQIENKGPYSLIVTRESTDRKYGKRESLFFYDLKKAIADKFKVDVVKKLAHKDGNLVDDNMYYIRQRKGDWCIYDVKHNERITSQHFDQHGEVILCVHYFDDAGEDILS